MLSQRYISDRFLPAKAIDLVDEAAAKLRTEIDSMPAELDESLRRQMQLVLKQVQSRVGIKTRHVADDHETVAFMGTQAAEMA